MINLPLKLFEKVSYTIERGFLLGGFFLDGEVRAELKNIGDKFILQSDDVGISVVGKTAEDAEKVFKTAMVDFVSYMDCHGGRYHTSQSNGERTGSVLSAMIKRPDIIDY